jgi:hypothetical protein
MSKAFLDVLHARQPKLDYISPAVCEYVFSGSGFSSLLLDENWDDDPVSGATFIIYGNGGDHRLRWNPVIGAICYMIYRADDPLNPLTSTYTLVADCVEGETWDPPPPPGGGPIPCYIIQALTEDGLGALSTPICYPAPASCPQCTGGGSTIQACFTDAEAQTFKLSDAFSFTPTLFTPVTGATFAITSGVLPPGLSLDASTGEISGTPIANGTFPFSLRVTYADGTGCTQNFVFTVEECIATSSPLPDATEGDLVLLQFTAVTPETPAVWFVSGGSLPAGVTLSDSGELSGSPAETGDLSFEISYAAGDVTCTKSYAWHIDPSVACITNAATLPQGTESAAYSETLVAGAPEVGQVWTVSVGALPANLTLNGATGAITGTPIIGSAGTYNFTVRITNLDTTFCEKAFSILVVEAGGCSGMPPTPDLATWSTVLLGDDSTISFDGATGAASLVCIDESQVGARASDYVCRLLASGDLLYTITFDYTITGAPYTFLPFFNPRIEMTGYLDDTPVDSDITGTLVNGSTGTLTVNITIPDDQALHTVKFLVNYIALPVGASTTAAGPITGTY